MKRGVFITEEIEGVNGLTMIHCYYGDSFWESFRKGLREVLIAGPRRRVRQIKKKLYKQYRKKQKSQLRTASICKAVR